MWQLQLQSKILKLIEKKIYIIFLRYYPIYSYTYIHSYICLIFVPFSGSVGKQIKGGYLMRYKSKYNIGVGCSFVIVWLPIHIRQYKNQLICQIVALYLNGIIVSCFLHHLCLITNIKINYDVKLKPTKNNIITQHHQDNKEKGMIGTALFIISMFVIILIADR